MEFPILPDKFMIDHKVAIGSIGFPLKNEEWMQVGVLA